MAVSGCLWDTPPADFTLSSNDIHIWCADLDLPEMRVLQLAQTLSADELKRADRFYFEQHKKRFIVRRGILRTLLGRYLNMSPDRLHFDYAYRGKPALAKSCGGDTIRFNLSDSDGVALYAVTSDRELGIDIEQIRPMEDAEQIAKRFFSEREYAVLRDIDPSQKQAAFFNCWTRKEAYIKAIGDGLALPLDEFNVSLAPGEPARLLSIKGDRQLATAWFLQHLNPFPGYVGAIALQGFGFNISCWEWVE
ncbi:4'-phosphopantetheinyl transferase superfamily protein [Planktothrix sp. FACHB-1355]|uniref:4'-phosphopantetheinyl transferase superfamily protein n=1 Tax=Aerosakkonema funiforme FACHB-1375 TaxID=2949571 RepID=A0A926VDV9_9CYAN|nr:MULTISPECIES: 4'-phosphopantetheinyl transferase superfamily protein [Oscillatoriales]MBD2182096.1 4'-phosphopantetheinyl transferase superfamily protein [Aerosakkonema funiforme FACHB-1375]MBD3559219.1 4'-phosphopantetheinyl transferase superfamily protein [Planktothrix sp. FACHB-1355]